MIFLTDLKNLPVEKVKESLEVVPEAEEKKMLERYPIDLNQDGFIDDQQFQYFKFHFGFLMGKL